MNIMPSVKPIVDPDVKNAFSDLDWISLIADKKKWLDNPQTGKIFTDLHMQWIKNSKLNNIEGLDDFPERYIINGCTEAITEYHWMFRDRRLRLHSGEYMFTAGLSLGDKFTWVHEDKFREGDALILSIPYAWTGNDPIDFEKTMEVCSELNIPVLLDCCFFGTCQDLDIKVNYPCVVAVCFSTSKAFATGTFRVGTLFAKDAPDHIKALNKFLYTPLLAAVIHTEMLSEFSADYIPTKYRKKQEEIAKEIGSSPSKTMMITNSDVPYEGADLSKISGGIYAAGWPSANIGGKDNYRWGVMFELTDWANLVSSDH